MVTDTEGYVHIIEYLTEHLYLFEHSNNEPTTGNSVIETIELELGAQIISVCSQNETLNFNQRNTIVREVDAILYDLQEVLSGVMDNIATPEQTEFLKELALLIKNLFDAVIHEQLLNNQE